MSHKILVTGASGYLGGRLYNYLKQQQNAPVIGTKRKGDKEFRTLDLLDESSFGPALESVDKIVHFAALNYQQCEQDPVLAQKVNVEQLRKFISVAKETGVKKFIYLSTVHVYGSPLEGLLREDGAVRPANHYARTHWEAEQVVKESGVTPVIIRLSNAIGAPVGPEVNTWMLIANDLCRQVIKTKNLVLRSSGVQTRNFVGISTLCGAISHFLAQNELKFDTYNFGSDHNLQVIQLVGLIQQAVERQLGYKPTIERPTPQLEEKPIRFDLCLDRLNSENIQLNQNLLSELEETVKFCKNNF